MASFFSDLGKTFQSAAKTIQKKTAEGMEATRRNGELRALRDEQNKLFATLGESYYIACREGGGQEQLDLLVRRIDEVAERIKAVTAELDALNDRKRCRFFARNQAYVSPRYLTLYRNLFTQGIRGRLSWEEQQESIFVLSQRKPVSHRRLRREL